MMSGAELRKRRFGRNVFVAGALGVFVLLIFAVSLVKFPDQMDALCENQPDKCPYPYSAEDSAQ